MTLAKVKEQDGVKLKIKKIPAVGIEPLPPPRPSLLPTNERGWMGVLSIQFAPELCILLGQTTVGSQLLWPTQ